MSSTRRDAQKRVAAYYESCLRELIGHVGIALDQYRTDGDAEQMNTALYQYHRAAVSCGSSAGCMAAGLSWSSSPV